MQPSESNPILLAVDDPLMHAIAAMVMAAEVQDPDFAVDASADDAAA